MTTEEISKLEAGPALDAMVARIIFGCNPKLPPKPFPDSSYECSCIMLGDAMSHGSMDYGFDHPRIRRFSTDISAAWQVREHVNKQCFSKRQRFNQELQLTITQRIGLKNVYISPEEIPLKMEPIDICRAALLVAERMK